MYNIKDVQKHYQEHELEDIAHDIVEKYNKDCINDNYSVVIGEYLSCIELQGLSMEDVVYVYSACMRMIEGDTIVHFFNDFPDLDKAGLDSYHIIAH